MVISPEQNENPWRKRDRGSCVERLPEYAHSSQGLALGQRVVCLGAAVLEELQAPFGLVLLADRLRGPGQ
ncbi:hypothetical protein GCM10010404_36390 [Nonomuraea africana]